MSKPKWMIRDCEHGKVWSFYSWEEMVEFVFKFIEPSA